MEINNTMWWRVYLQGELKYHDGENLVTVAEYIYIMLLIIIFIKALCEIYLGAGDPVGNYARPSHFE